MKRKEHLPSIQSVIISQLQTLYSQMCQEIVDVGEYCDSVLESSGELEVWDELRNISDMLKKIQRFTGPRPPAQKETK